VIHRRQPNHVAVSSAAHLCMGSLTPMLCSDTAHFKLHGGEVVKYRDADGLVEWLLRVLDGDADVADAARSYVEAHSADSAAETLLEALL